MSTFEAVSLVMIGSALIVCCVWRETLARQKREQLRLRLSCEMASDPIRS